MKKSSAFFTSLFLVLISTGVQAQFAPAAGQQGSTAIHQDSNIIVGWSNECTVERGWVDLSDTTLFRASAGGPKEVIGAATGIGIMSLGDNGAATVSFQYTLEDGPGYDFVVFENGLNDTFLELAFVEVSSDGVLFVRFPPISHTDTTVQIDNWGGVQPTEIHNLAGKYRIGFGTPFDLNELANTPGLDVMNVSHIRIVDVVGSMQDIYAQRDSEGNKINDPWPTPWPTGGFDLDAVGAIHWNAPPTGTAEQYQAPNLRMYPNPAQAGSAVQLRSTSTAQQHIRIVDGLGRMVTEMDLRAAETAQFAPQTSGIYSLQVVEANGSVRSQKLIVW